MACRILCAGDSLVEGYNAPGYGGWRIGLYRLLTNAGIEFDFVGGVTSGEAQNLPDRACEGHQGEALPYFVAAMPTYMSTYTPDVVIVCAGTAHAVMDEPDGPDDYGDLVAAIYAASPTCKVILCKLPDVTGEVYAEFSPLIVEINDAIDDVAAVHAALGRTCLVARCSFQTPTDDGVHPTPAGYEVMADVIGDVLIRLLPPTLRVSRPVGGNGRGARNR